VSSEDGYTPPNEMPPSPIHQVLVGQKAMVTGASKGLGQAMAIGFAQAGADVLVNYSSDEQGARQTAESIERLGRKAVVFKANQSREDEVQAMFDCMFKSFGRLDICVPNAAIQLNATLPGCFCVRGKRFAPLSARESTGASPTPAASLSS
jgi:glucose 1-dehydrogenase